MNEQNELLMVLQAGLGEDKKWTIPSGGKEKTESFEECCEREVFEETGYYIQVESFIYIKETTLQDIEVLVHYFAVTCIGDSAMIQDPDELIYDIAWKTAEEIEQLPLASPEDRILYLKWLMDKEQAGSGS